MNLKAMKTTCLEEQKLGRNSLITSARLWHCHIQFLTQDDLDQIHQDSEPVSFQK
jgi:hypothetical protein